MSKRNPELLINDILDSCNKILQYTNSMNFEEFSKDHKTIDAVIRNFEIIGEAANRLPEAFCQLPQFQLQLKIWVLINATHF